jgi:chorismate-pyruvate lyase
MTLASMRPLAVLALFCALSARALDWPDTPVARLEALALLQTLNAELLSHDSATLTLDRWCESHQMATPAKVVVERIHGVEKTPSDQVRQLLAVNGSDSVRYRHVRLHCGEHVLSEADNWYVPSRLTAQMNEVLDTTDTAFGRAVQALHFHRHTLSARLLWSPLPLGWDMGATIAKGAAKTLAIPAETLEHQALLSLPDGTPISMVVETYTAEVLNFRAPSLRTDH